MLVFMVPLMTTVLPAHHWPVPQVLISSLQRLPPAGLLAVFLPRPAHLPGQRNVQLKPRPLQSISRFIISMFMRLNQTPRFGGIV